MRKKRPFISVIIYSADNLNLLKSTIQSLSELENAELIIINSVYKQESNSLVETYLDNIDDSRITYYQSNHNLNKNKSRNIGINLSSGYWLHFINEGDVFTKNFVNFLNNSRLDVRMNFYCLQIYRNKKKIKNNHFSSSFLFNEISAFLINGEWINQIDFKFIDYLNIDEALPFIKKLYNFKNVNYINLRRISVVVKRNVYEEWNQKDIEQEIFKTFHCLFNKKEKKYKNYVLILMNDIYVNLCKKKDLETRQKFFRVLKSIKKYSKLHFFDYLKMGLKFWINSLKWRTLLFIETNFKSRKSEN